MGIEQFEIRHSESDTINLIMYPPPFPRKYSSLLLNVLILYILAST